MELSEIRTRIDAVDDQLLKLFLERMELAEEVAAYKNEHHLPILNKQREREILAKVTAKAGDKERYAYHLYSTLFELARSRQAELVDLPTRVAERVEKSLAAGGPVFPQTGRPGLPADGSCRLSGRGGRELAGRLRPPAAARQHPVCQDL